MVLDFNNNTLFKTSNEERYKGINTERIGLFPASGTSAADDTGIGVAWEQLNPTLTLSVNPDEKVFIVYNATAQGDAVNDNIVVKIVRGTAEGDTIMGKQMSSDLTPDGAEDLILECGIGMNTIDDPGEGNITYTVWGKSSSGNGKVVDQSLSAFVLTVK